MQSLVNFEVRTMPWRDNVAWLCRRDGTTVAIARDGKAIIFKRYRQDPEVLKLCKALELEVE